MKRSFLEQWGVPAVIASAIAIFVTAVFIANRFFYVPSNALASEGAYASATITFMGVPEFGSSFELPSAYGVTEFSIEDISEGQNGDYQNGKYYIAAGDSPSAATLATRLYSVLNTRYNDCCDAIVIEPSVDGNVVTLTETRLGAAYNGDITYSVDINWLVSPFSGGENPDPAPVIGAQADTPVGVFITDNFGSALNDTLKAQNNTENVTWPMSGGSAYPYIGLSDQKFDIVYFDIRGSVWDTTTEPSLEYSDGADGWNTLSEVTFDPSPTPFNKGEESQLITSLSFTPPEDWGQNSVEGVTAYYIRFSDMSGGIHGAGVRQISLRTYGANVAPTLSVNSPIPYLTGTGDVSFNGTVNDDDTDDVSIKVEYEAGSTCAYGVSKASATVSSTATGMNTGNLTVNNSSTYQVSGIDTTMSDEYIFLIWSSAADVPAGDGSYCIYFTPNDGTEDGTRVAVSTTIDNAAPTQPGNLVVASTGTTRAVLTLPTTTSTDSNFSQYKIYYKQGTSSVDTSDTAFDGTSGDTDLADANFNGTTQTTITGLTANTQYVANIYAYDSYGNYRAAASEVTFTTKALPIATGFTTDNGSTDFSAAEDISSVPSVKLANTYGSVQWTNSVNAAGANLDADVVVGDGFVSVDAGDLDGTFDAPATVTLNVGSCDSYAIYYAPNFYTTKADIIANGQICNQTTNPACTVVSCTNNVLTFTVPHFDGFGVGEVADAGGSGGQIQRNLNKPQVYQFTINGGVTATDDRNVNLLFGVSDVAQMAISNDGNFSEAAYQPYETTATWQLSEGAGKKNVYVRFLSPTGIITEVVQSIIFDPSGETIPQETNVPPMPNDSDAPVQENTDVLPTEEPLVEAGCALEPLHAYNTGSRTVVYYITENCLRKRIPNSEVYFSYFSSFNEIRPTTQEKLDRVPLDPIAVLPYGPNFKTEEGTLMKTIFGPEVYVVEKKLLRHVTTEAVFLGRGFKWSAVYDVVPTVIERFSIGNPLK